MAETIVEKGICEKCGVETRENTHFCYNCGIDLTDDGTADVVLLSDNNGSVDSPNPESQKALEELAAKLDANNEVDADKLAQAAEQRRKARITRRQPRQFGWEPADESSGMRVLAVALLVAIAAVIIVYLTVYWR
ncbi:MAG: zinc ribbon domain-containing protein [Pyrinomonadaceae bacterium]